MAGPPSHELAEYGLRAQLELRAQGFEVMTLAETLGRARRVASREVPGLAAGLEEAVTRASEGVAFGRAADVLSRYSSLVAEAEQALPWLESERAYRALGDLCLQLAHASLRMAQPAEAHERMVQCLRLVPGLTANPELFPDDLLERFAIVRAEIERVQRTLDVALRGGAPDCRVEVQGHPLERARPLAPGPAYVTLACPTPVKHALIVNVAAPGQLLVINVDVEAALEVRPSELGLRAGDVAEATLDRLLGGSHGEPREQTPDALLLLFADPSAAGGVSLRMRARASDTLGHVSELSEIPPELSRLFGTLRSEKQVESVGARPTASAPRVSLGEATHARSAALLLATLGAASQVAAWGVFGRYQRLDSELGDTLALDRDQVSSGYQRDLDQRDRLAPWIGGLGLASGVSFAAAAVAGLKPQREAPWWVWTSGAAGLGFLAGSAVVLSQHGDVEQVTADARRARQTLPLSALLLGDAVGLLAIPFTHWARRRYVSVQALAAPAMGLAVRVVR